MASNSSGALSPSRTYKLGDYTFRLVKTYLPDEGITSIQCHASDGTSNKQTGKDYSGVVNVNSWNVEAEDKTVSIYVNAERPALDITPIIKPVPCDAAGRVTTSVNQHKYSFINGTGLLTHMKNGSSTVSHLYASASSGVWYLIKTETGSEHDRKELTSTFTYGGRTVYFYWDKNVSWVNSFTEIYPVCNGGDIVSGNAVKAGATAWTMIYGDLPLSINNLIARFEINIADADGNTWDYPGDTGEPSKTLHITVTGALSGRHNDPLNDTTYQYTPSDREQADMYGSGGVGGNGGAGGAGASTVIIYNCATDKAGYTEEIAIARRHGYGSGAGKGGKGGDGCILVYY